jgi:hypothetical protein
LGLDLTDGQRAADPLVPYVVRRRIVHERLVADEPERVGREEARRA